MQRITVPIRGMHCASCELLIEEQLKKISGVTHVAVSQKKAQAHVTYCGVPPSNDAIAKAVQEAGYEVGEKQKLPWISRNPADYKDMVKAGAILFVLYFAASRFGLFDLKIDSPNSGVAIALLIGLVAGVSTCMALVGGLVLGLSARHAEQHPESTPMQKFRPHIFFNVGRIVGYALLGGLVGLVGKAFSPSPNVLGILTIVIGGVMIFFGLKLIEIFPVLRDKNITLPSGLARMLGIRREVKEYSHKGAMTMGVLTFFLPCGFTQAMQLYAISTGSFWQGMMIMGLFALGTAPGLLGIGGLTSIMKGRKARIFFMIAGIAVILFGWFNITNGSRLLSVGGGKSVQTTSPASNADVQEVRMTQGGGGYSPNSFIVEKGRPVKWIINSTSPFSCASSIVMPKYGIRKSLKSGENVIMFTPTETGTIPFSCSMGMYRGSFTVTEADVDSTNSGGSVMPFQPGPSCGPYGCDSETLTQ
ncbi:MAG: sulfite exporter TauE/SafE family protein [bacterium]|nr:sulfite exporter TauE/SafE family protein [bacterium]